jgi:hypothetical protein
MHSPAEFANSGELILIQHLTQFAQLIILLW